MYKQLEIFHLLQEYMNLWLDCIKLTLLPPNRRIFGMNPVVDSLKETIRSFIAPPVLSPK